MRIHRFDEPYLLAPSPALDFFLAINRHVWIEEALVVRQLRKVVPARETGDKFVLVFKYAAAPSLG